MKFKRLLFAISLVISKSEARFETDTEYVIRDLQRLFCDSVSPTEYILSAKFRKSNHCYKIQVRNGGEILVDTKDPGCAKFSKGNDFKGVPVSTYQRTDPGGIAVYKGLWSGSITLLRDTSLSGPKFAVEGNAKLKTFSCTLTVPACEEMPVDGYNPSLTSLISGWFSQENGGASETGAIYGIQCQGPSCDEKRLKYHDPIKVFGSTSDMYWTDWFSQEDDQEEEACANGYLVSKIQCFGWFCDMMRLLCTRPLSDYTVTNKRHETNFFSEGNIGFTDCPKGYYIYGINCRDNYCGDINLQCVQVLWTSQSASPTAFPTVSPTKPVQIPSLRPSEFFSGEPSSSQTLKPSFEPTPPPSVRPTLEPSGNPSLDLVHCESISPSEYTLSAKFRQTDFCYRIQIKKGGKLSVDRNDPGCAKFSKGNNFAGALVSTYQRTDPGGIAIYEGKWNGSITMLHNPSLSGATFEIDFQAGIFVSALTVPTCPSPTTTSVPSTTSSSSPSVSPSIQPASVPSSIPSILPTSLSNLSSKFPTKFPSAVPSQLPTVGEGLVACASQLCVGLIPLGDPVIEVVAVESSYGIRCCSETDLPGFVSADSKCPNLWVTSKNEDNTCVRDTTYFRGLAICKSLGARLCTVQENLDGCTNPARCNLATKMVWASYGEDFPSTQPSSEPSQSSMPSSKLSCNVPNSTWWGDGYCDGPPYNTPECGYDRGDCEEFNKLYPDCNVEFPFFLGDGGCDGGLYDVPECGNDGGDCSIACDVPNSTLWGDGYCDPYPYNTLECDYDGGDCDEFNKLYPDCNVEYPFWVDDGGCDGGDYNTPECNYDGGDCKEFNKKYPDCTVNEPWRLGDGECDGYPYNVPECGNDGQDC